MVSDKESLHRCHLGVALGVHRVPYSRGWGLYCSFSPYGLCLPASVSPPGPWWGMGRVAVVPGMRQGGARQAVNGVWAAGLRRGRRQGRAWNQMWRRRPGRPGGSHARPGAHMAGGCGCGPRGPTTPDRRGGDWALESAEKRGAPKTSLPPRLLPAGWGPSRPQFVCLSPA